MSFLLPRKIFLLFSQVFTAGCRAVPFLIWKLNDSRKVVPAGGPVGEKNAGTTEKQVSVGYVAHRALEEIFQRKTGLAPGDLEDVARLKQVRVVWSRMWRKHCGAYLRGESLKHLLKSGERQEKEQENQTAGDTGKGAE